MPQHYEAIIIGTGAGGGTLALQLASAGKQILILERGPFLPQEKPNWNTTDVFLENRYHTKDVWIDKEGKDLHPQQAYFVGGQTKVYGAAMFRLRAEDFGELRHHGGISPPWPVTYEDMEPFYTRAEKLFDVHGHLNPDLASQDPTEPYHSAPYPFPALPDEPPHGRDSRLSPEAWLPPFPRAAWTQAQFHGSPPKQVHTLRHLRRISMPCPRQI